MNKEQYRIVMYDTSTTPDSVLVNIGYSTLTLDASLVLQGAINVPNDGITSLNSALSTGLAFARRFESNGVKGHVRGEIYGQVFDDTSHGQPAAPTTPSYVLTNADKTEELYCAFDVPDLGKRQRINASNKPAPSAATFDADVHEDVPQDNG